VSDARCPLALEPATDISGRCTFTAGHSGPHFAYVGPMPGCLAMAPMWFTGDQSGVVEMPREGGSTVMGPEKGEDDDEG
jgi:hypothetical protein